MDHWHVRRLSWFEGLKPALAEEIRRAATVRSFACGDPVFGPSRQPENVWLLQNGLVRIHRLAADGREVTIALAQAGDLFGEVPVIGDLPRVSFAQAVRRSTCWRIPREAFLRVVRSNPEAGFAISKNIAGKMARIESRLADLAFCGVESRVARTLLHLAEDFGRPAGDWVELDLPLNQSELAKLVGASRQSVSESLRDLSMRGCVARERGRLALRIAALHEVSAPAE